MEYEALKTRNPRRVRSILLSSILATFAACGGGSDAPTVNANTAPTASAGTDKAVVENSVVQLNGSGADPGDTLTFAWTQMSGTTVSINDPESALANFIAPDVAANAPESLSFRLTVTDAGGLSDSDDIGITVSEPALVVAISGILEFEFPNPNAGCDGLNFSSVQLKPMRAVTVQLIDASSNAVLATTVSDDNGNYDFSADGQTPVFVRVRAELKNPGGQVWDVEVRDNTSNTAVPLAQRPLYVLDGPPGSPGGADETRNLRATHGWTGNGFTGARTAAPFSILDTIYSAMKLVMTADPTANFASLDAFWSVNNNSTQGDLDIGELGTSFYRGDIDSLFLLGMDGDDIEEFDDHVIVHEWGHYFEDNFSRSDSIGGQHGLNNLLDPRVAFGEGFATALSGMALNNPTYCDTFWSGGILRGFDIRIENEGTGTVAGWYNESSVMKILYDLWDTNIDGNDTGSLGFGPIYDVFTGPQAGNSAFTTIFSFIEALKVAGTGQNPFIDTLLADENIVAAGIDRWGSTELNHPGSGDSDPAYTTIVPNGIPVNVCSNSEFDSVGPNATGNKLNEHRFLRMNIATAQRYSFSIQTDAATLALLPPDDPADDRDQSDPDMFYFLNGQVQNRVVGVDVEGTSGDANVENFTSAVVLSPGEYVIDFNDWRFEDVDTDPGYPPRTCFDFTVTPAP
jgi:hypothetical protein